MLRCVHMQCVKGPCVTLLWSGTSTDIRLCCPHPGVTSLTGVHEVGTLTLVMHWMTPPYLREIWGGDPNDITPPLREVRKCSYIYVHFCKIVFPNIYHV